uniref:Chromo domain-containing protein n=1 Tax=Peronospora matthiolae TaxID=2874970 RepID=A0AAV1US91_9STRA
MGHAYTIELPRKMRTHHTFFVGRLRPYYQYEPVSRCEEHLHVREPRPPLSGPVSTSQSGRLAKRPAHAVERCPDELKSARHEENESNVRALRNCNYPLHDHGAHKAESVHAPGHLATVLLHGSDLEHRADPTLEPDQVFPPPPHPLVDSNVGQRFLVERILNHRDLNGVRTSYLVRWCGYTQAWDSWEPRAQLIAEVLGLIEQYDETHPLRLKKGRRKSTSPNASTRTARCQSIRPSRKRCALSSRDH